MYFKQKTIVKELMAKRPTMNLNRSTQFEKTEWHFRNFCNQHKVAKLQSLKIERLDVCAIRNHYTHLILYYLGHLTLDQREVICSEKCKLVIESIM